MRAMSLYRALEPLLNSPVKNYVIPGLTSSLVGGNGHGQVRLFSNERQHDEVISPHSHRFAFTCFVLAGSVRNRIWTQQQAGDGDEYESLEIVKTGQFGEHEKRSGERAFWGFTDMTYDQGDVYSMRSEEVHSIYFSRGAKVLFFEGPEVSKTSIVLQPVVDNKTVPTFAVADWMFEWVPVSERLPVAKNGKHTVDIWGLARNGDVHETYFCDRDTKSQMSMYYTHWMYRVAQKPAPPKSESL